jgi:chorismate lyase/3-hydroxybenzoate synthase
VMARTRMQESPTTRPSAVSSSFRVGFAGSPPVKGLVTLQIAAPWLAGEPVEELFIGARAVGSVHGVHCYEWGNQWVGHARALFNAKSLAETTQQLYERVIAACGGRQLYRIWNYVPRINEITVGLENYRAFCLGRSLAFEIGLGADFASRLPAASAVGTIGDHIEVIFVAGDAPPVHYENPAQVPAYQYPVEHGPRPPSFARATVARTKDRTLTFISGTAAIRGHETVAPGSLEEQLDCTLENLRLISLASGGGEQLGGGTRLARFIKVYLRRIEDLSAAKNRLEAALIKPSDQVIYLQSDICREALNVEIEVTLIGDASTT